MIQVLLIDDENEYCESLAKLADAGYGIQITHFQNHEDGFAALAKNPDYKALILDAKCFINAEQETESDDALDYALKRLADFEQSTVKHLPFAVNTGYDYFARFFEKGITDRKAKIFSKAKSPKELFEYLISAINNTENMQIEKQYADVFEVFEKGYLDNELKMNLLNILKNMKKVELAEIRKNLALIRNVKEKMTQRLLSANNSYAQPDLIAQFSVHLIPKVASNYGSHTPRNNDILPSKYTVIALTNALLELLLWFKSEMNKI